VILSDTHSSTKLPEALEANHIMADFLAKELAK